LNRKVATLIALGLIVIVVLTLFFTHSLVGNQSSSRTFYVGVEYAYSDNLADLHALVDKVKDYTNLLVLGSVGITFNQSALTEACDYIFNAKLHFIVLFTGLDMYQYNTTVWMKDAQFRYGEQFLGIDRYDEPGGNQLDNSKHQLINNSALAYNPTYAQIADHFVGTLSFFPSYYLLYGAPKVFTSDYGLYWFDYRAGYSGIFGEFVGNESRERHVALCRGAADAFGRDWGIVITWQYDHDPYIESADNLSTDLALAYSAGAKYTVVFSYAPTNTTNYGILTEKHFEALKSFWNSLHNNPASFSVNSPTVAYVVPSDYGFGFRSPNDRVWGLFSSDNQSQKIYNDVSFLTTKYGARLNILYDDPAIIMPLLHNYTIVYFWNQTIT
jgi:hypothetical protein